MKKKIAILGSTGSIGTQTLDIIREHHDKFKIIGLAAGYNLDLIEEQIREFSPALVSVATPELIKELELRLADLPNKPELLHGIAGMNQIAGLSGLDMLITAVVGAQGLLPTMTAIQAGTNIGLANKETLVAAGSIVMQEAKRCGVDIIPVDSEHSAIFQCLQGEDYHKISKIHLTASGGSFRGKQKSDLANVTVAEALKHPNWTMGSKITIDSATLMNKGLEVIEAHWLFDVAYDDINVVVHPESIIHSMVEFTDSSIIAQLGLPNMRIPIQYALAYPERIPSKQNRLDFFQLGQMNFARPDFDTFGCLQLAFDAGREGGTAPAVMNAANEVAVQMFLENKIKFLQIEEIISRILDRHEVIYQPSLDEILEADRWARNEINNGGVI